MTKLTPGEAEELVEFCKSNGGDARLVSPTDASRIWGAELISGNARHTITTKAEMRRFLDLYMRETFKLAQQQVAKETWS